MNRLTSKLNPTDAMDECHLDIFKSNSLKVPKLLFRNSLATSIRQSLSVLCSLVRLLNLVCVIVERSHVFSLQAEEKDLSPAALVAGFTRRSLHMVVISLIIHFSVSGKFGVLDNKSLIRRFVYLLFVFWSTLWSCQNTAQFVKILSDSTQQNV